MHTNKRVIDSVVYNEEYAKRAVELGQGILASTEHGFCGDIFECYELAEKYGLKFLAAAEAYWVKDRFEKDRSNCHIFIAAKNEHGRQELNEVLSEANETGFYYQPRLDLELLLKLPKDDVWVTSACFDKTMTVTTKDGYKTIDSVNPGDLVLTHLGNWEKVITPTRRPYRGKMCSVKVEGCRTELKCTEDHLFPTIKKTHSDVTREIIWKKASELQSGDRILDAIDTYQEPNEFLNVSDYIGWYSTGESKNKIKSPIIVEKIPIDGQFLEILGLYAAEGNTTKSHNYLCFTLHKDKTELHEMVNSFSRKYLNKDASIQKKKGTNGVSVVIHSKEISLLFSNLIGEGALNKKVPKFVKTLNPELQMSFIRGLFLGDGHVKKNKKEYSISFCTISKQMAYEVVHILERNNLRCMMHTTEESTDKNNVHHCLNYTVEIHSKPFKEYWIDFLKKGGMFCFDWNKEIAWNSKKSVVLNGTKYFHKNVKKVTSYDYEGFVYCLNVERDNSFKIEGVSTHNCLAYWKYEDIDEITLKLFDHFKGNFYLEVQYHDTDTQREINRHIIDLSNKHSIPIIMGCDSHYIFPEQADDRTNFLNSKNLFYESEDGWFLDMPTGEEAFKRFKKQGILNEYQIKEAIENTNVFLEVEEYNSPIFTKDIKMPTLYPDKTQEEKNKIFVDLIWELWEKEKQNIDPSEWDHYVKEISDEVEVIIDTFHADYFLLDYELVKKAVSMGGVITPTGRGSGSSFYINKLLGFTTVDRISAPVPLIPSRFMSKSRILEAKSIADLDLNTSRTEIFAQAQAELLGERHSYPMTADGTLQGKGAWKMFSRANNIDPQIANDVSKQIDKYESAKKYADTEEEKEAIDIHKYIDAKYIKMFNESKKYLGIIDNVKVHACGYLLYMGDIRREIGLMMIKSATTKKQHLTCLMDGKYVEKYKFLKNDLLKVSVIDLIDRVFTRVGEPMIDSAKLIKLCENDKKVWDVYEMAATMGINQVEQSSTAGRVAQYKPQNISELTAFISAIRPGATSIFKAFSSREPFDYGIKTLDDLIQTKEFPYSFILYQETQMNILEYAGIPMDQTYEIIKSISKKRIDKIMSYKKAFLKGFEKKVMEGQNIQAEQASEASHQVWQIIEDSASYMYNCSHAYCVAIDSLYGAYLKSHHPLEFYEVFLQLLEEKGEKDRMAATKKEAERAYGIFFPPMRFRQNNTQLSSDAEKNQITNSLKSIKGFNKALADFLYSLKDLQFYSFIDFLIHIEENGTLSTKIGELIKIQYFEEFGKNGKLLELYEEFKNGKNKYSKKHTEKTKAKRIEALRELEASIEPYDMGIKDQMDIERELLGYIQCTYPDVDKRNVYIMDVDTKYAPRITCHSLGSGKTQSVKIQKALFKHKPLVPGDIIFCEQFKHKPALKKIGDEFVEQEEKQWWCTKYNVVNHLFL